MLTRSNRPETRNPLLTLPSAARLAELPEDSRAALRALLLDLRADASAKGDAQWSRRKYYTGGYWKVLSVYVLHALRLLRQGATPERGEIAGLERKIAYRAARSDVECHCACEAMSEDGIRWYDAGDVLYDEGHETVAMAVRYLELRGLLERHPSEPWVRVLDDGAGSC